eukprot:CAMPEP_0115104630 /NCGR_PEP_ID=MMETSP0227-20121206/35442_1 /TAXON_ID=89957 /ORGANISM="Polarella glacialis, Strain CCMP 1383" /LENGTH=62 /DNA_ID=CAMNT_0002501609 /DNA_START=489 /DNA_END=674 /DNA_ORIENTATION=-
MRPASSSCKAAATASELRYLSSTTAPSVLSTSATCLAVADGSSLRSGAAPRAGGAGTLATLA